MSRKARDFLALAGSQLWAVIVFLELMAIALGALELSGLPLMLWALASLAIAMMPFNVHIRRRDERARWEVECRERAAKGLRPHPLNFKP